MGAKKKTVSLKKRRIGVIMGGTSPEREISLKTGTAVFRALKASGYKASRIDADKDIIEKLLKTKIDVAFIALHGGWGENGGIQGVLEIMGILYTGSGVCASAVAMDKILSKEIFFYHGLPTPEFWIYSGKRSGIEKFIKTQSVKLPVVVKPATGGSTIGISIVSSKKDLKKAVSRALSFDSTILIEKYIEGRDLTVGILKNRPLPIVEMVPKSGFYDYRSKYKMGKTKYICPAEIPSRAAEKVQDIAMKAYLALGCKGAPRIDFRLTPDNRPFILEANTIPGMTETSLLPMAASKAGIGFNRLVEIMLEESVS